MTFSNNQCFWSRDGVGCGPVCRVGFSELKPPQGFKWCALRNCCIFIPSFLLLSFTSTKLLYCYKQPHCILCVLFSVMPDDKTFLESLWLQVLIWRHFALLSKAALRFRSESQILCIILKHCSGVT